MCARVAGLGGLRPTELRKSDKVGLVHGLRRGRRAREHLGDIHEQIRRESHHKEQHTAAHARFGQESAHLEKRKAVILDRHTEVRQMSAAQLESVELATQLELEELHRHRAQKRLPLARRPQAHHATFTLGPEACSWNALRCTPKLGTPPIGVIHSIFLSGIREFTGDSSTLQACRLAANLARTRLHMSMRT